MSRELLWTLSIAVGSILIGVVIFFLELRAASEVNAAGRLGILAAIATASFGFIARCYYRVQDLRDSVLKWREEHLEQAAQVSFAYKLAQFHRIIKLSGLNTMTSQLRSLSSSDQGFTITGTDWAMRSNTNFWRELLRYKRINAHDMDQVKVVHSASPVLWNNDEALASLRAQRAFIHAKGKITRVVVGDQTVDDIRKWARGEQEFSNDAERLRIENDLEKTHPWQYIQLLKYMKEHEIDVRYAEGSSDDFGSDFALVNVGTSEEPRRIVMEWIHSSKLGWVSRCQFLDWADETYENEWVALERRGTTRTYDEIFSVPDRPAPAVPEAAE
jgi:hypothetical protein